MSNFLSYDEDIHQQMVKFYSKSFGISPIASKIYSYLIFDFQKRGVSFDELVELFKVSKSSVSECIHVLLDLQLVMFKSKNDDRKKYFFTNPEFSKMHFSNVLNRLQEERDLLQKISLFKNKQTEKLNLEENTFEQDAYKSFLDKGIQNFTEILKKLSTTYEK